MRFLPLVLILAALSGCMSVNDKLVRKVGPVVPPKQPAIVEVQYGEFIQKLNDEGDHRGVFSNNAVLKEVSSRILGRWKSENIVSAFGPAGALPAAPTYTLTVSGFRNEDSSIPGAVFCGLTFFLLPTSSTLTYDLTFDLVNNSTGRHYKSHTKNSVTTYQQLFLLPATPFYLKAYNDAFNDIADYVYDDLRKQGAF